MPQIGNQRSSQSPPPARAANTMTDMWAVHDLVARFDDAVNRRDRDEMRKLWAEDSVWSIGHPRPMSVRGADQIIETWWQMTISSEWMFRGSFAGVVTIDGTTGTGRWPCIETGNLAAIPDGPPPGYDNRAIYEDVYVKIGGTWLFGSRNYIYLWLSTDKVAGAPVKLEEDTPA